MQNKSRYVPNAGSDGQTDGWTGGQMIGQGDSYILYPGIYIYSESTSVVLTFELTYKESDIG